MYLREKIRTNFAYRKFEFIHELAYDVMKKTSYYFYK